MESIMPMGTDSSIFNAHNSPNNAVGNSTFAGEAANSDTGPSHGSYPYTPLIGPKVIRLIDLQPGQKDDPVSVRLFSVSLESAPPYDAISYVWGDPDDTIPISCNGIPFPITRSLHWALIH